MATAVVPARASRSNIKLAAFVVFFAVTAFVTFMKNRQILDPGSEIAQHFAPAKWYVMLHGGFAGLALILGAFQFSNRLRAKFLKVHRALGYVYITCVFVGGPIAIPVALRVDTLSLVAASAVQSFGWIVCTAIALACVRSGNIAQHRRWMIRGYAFAVVFTVARLIIPIPPILRMGFTGIEMVVWTTIALAAFLPSVFLDWRTMFPKKAIKTAAADD